MFAWVPRQPTPHRRSRNRNATHPARRGDRAGRQHPDAGDRGPATRGGLLPLGGLDLAGDLGNKITGWVQLSAMKVDGNTGLRRMLCRRFQQAVDALHTRLAHDLELGQRRADGVDDLCHLPDQTIPGVVMRQDCLVPLGLARREAHAGQGHRIVDRFASAASVVWRLMGGFA